MKFFSAILIAALAAVASAGQHCGGELAKCNKPGYDPCCPGLHCIEHRCIGIIPSGSYDDDEVTGAEAGASAGSAGTSTATIALIATGSAVAVVAAAGVTTYVVKKRRAAATLEVDSTSVALPEA
eukprot:Clim_evm4s47 gene=Clim_evmTU4s47